MVDPQIKSLQNPTQEQSPAAEAFARAEDNIYGIIESPDFKLSCDQQGLDINKSIGSEAYWDTVAGMAVNQAEQERADGVEPLEVNVFELLALAPSYLKAQDHLTRKDQMPYGERQIARQKVSYFNGLVRNLGADFPDVRVSELMGGLRNVTDIAGMSTSDSAAQLYSVVRGAQHELAFGQILSHTGHAFREATLEEDLKGIDYVVDHLGNELYIDVKASLSEVEQLGAGTGAFAIKRGRREGDTERIVMFSMARDEEFGDHLAISDDLAASRAAAVENCLTQAQNLQQIA